MGVINNLTIVIGLDAVEARDASGKSIFERYKEGAWTDKQEDSLSSLREWLGLREPDSEKDPSKFCAHGAGAFGYGGKGAVIAGVEACCADVSSPRTCSAGPVTVRDIDRLAKEARDGLRRYGVEEEPRVFLCWHVY